MSSRFVIKWNSILIAILAIASASAEPSKIEYWILRNLEDEGRRVADATLQRNGQDLALLVSSTDYVPFFSEVPSPDRLSPGQVEELEDVLAKLSGGIGGSKSPPGGYLFRLTFEEIDLTLYRLSSGSWLGGTWQSPQLSLSLDLDPNEVWMNNGQEEWAFASLQKGNPPILRTFDTAGLESDEITLDLSKFEESLANALGTAAGSKAIIRLEKVLLAEYLSDQEPGWRPLEISEHLNYRNQHAARGEDAHIRPFLSFSRSDALRILGTRDGNRGESPLSGEIFSPPQAVDDGRPVAVVEPTASNKFLWAAAITVIVAAVFVAVGRFVFRQNK